MHREWRLKMPAAKVYDPLILAAYFKEWNETSDKLKRGNIIRNIAASYGVSEGAIRKRFNQMLTGESPFQAASARRTRKATPKREAAKSRRRELATTVATIKESTRVGRKHYIMPTDKAMMIAVNEGYCKTDELPDRSTMDRWLKEFGLTGSDFQKEEAAVSWVFKYAGEMYFCDATPLNKIYMRVDGEIVSHDADPRDKHLDDDLRKKNYRKIWIYGAADGYSGVYYLRAYAPETGGENSIDWMDFFAHLFLSKENYPLEGVPDIIYSDKGSGLISGATRNFLMRLESRVESHFPGNPRAKGRIEGRFGGFKRSYEVMLNALGDRLQSLDDLNHFLYVWARHQCEKEGKFTKFLQSAQFHPLRKVTQANIEDARVEKDQRVVNKYGCISMQSKEYFVNKDLVGVKVWVYRDLHGRLTAQDVKTGMLYHCDPQGRHTVYFGSYVHNGNRHEWSDSEAHKLRTRVTLETAKIRKTISMKSMLPPENNVSAFPARGNYLETYSVAAPSNFETIDDAKTYLVVTTGVPLSSLPEILLNSIEVGLSTAWDAHGHIPSDYVKVISNIIRNEADKLELNQKLN